MSLWNSLRFKMPAIVLIGIIPPMLGAIFYASYRADIQLRQDAKENIATQAELLQNTISWWNQMNVLNLKQLSRQPEILSMDAERQKLILSSLIETHPNLYLASTVNLNGLNMARSDGGKPIYYGDRSWFLQAKVGKEISYQTLISRSIMKPAICMGTPIRQQPSEIVGVAMLCSELSALAEQIGQLQFGETGYAILVDRTGKVLAHPNSALLSGTRLHDLSQYPPIKNVMEGREGFFTFTDDRDTSWVSYGTSLENGWKIAIIQQETEFLKSEREFQTSAYSVSLVAAIAVSILTWLLANYLIRPIGQLTTAAKSISEENLDKTVEVKRRDELGILATSFNQMAGRLKISFEDLEHRVRERTAELSKLKDAAENANQAKDRFLACISHELRSPLSTIISYASILQKKLDLKDADTESEQGLETIRASGIHLLNLIEDILDFSKAKAGKIELHPTHLNWQSFLSEIVEIVKLTAREKQLQLECITEGNLTQNVWVDRKRLKQVLINLLNNAIKFTEQGKVTLKVTVIESTELYDFNKSYPQQKFRFEIIDTGIGISSYYLEKIFQPFEQSIDSEQKMSGTGLGLPISKQIVEMMGGRLRVKSKPRVGSTFWFDISLPLAEIDSNFAGNTDNTNVDIYSETTAKRAVKALPSASYKPKILVVDDREENYILVSSILAPLGFEVMTAVNGLQALDIVAFFQPDLILLDLYMPIKTGFTLIRDLQKMPQFEVVPIILFSSCNYETLQEASQRYGCQGFLTKPIDEKQLLALLNRLGLFSFPEKLSKK